MDHAVDVPTCILRARDLDWDDLERVNVVNQGILGELSETPGLLRDMLERLPSRGHLVGLCESYDVLEKLVLHDDAAGFRVRLHVFLAGHFDRPHNHRWSYTSRVLTGGYEHRIYRPPEHVDDVVARPHALGPPVVVRREEAGGGYTLHHSMVHAAIADALTTTLIIRGPAVSDRFFVLDRDTGRGWWQYGAANTPKGESMACPMDATDVAAAVDRVVASGMLA